MRPYIRSLIAAALLVTIAMQSQAGPSSRLAYAQKCAVEMGTIPSFNCMDGARIPITQGGTNKTSSPGGENCDNPVQLGLGGDQCVPNARFLRLFTGVSTVETVVICRKYDVNDSGVNDTKFTDIAMIQHNRATGNTCYYQSKLEEDLDGTSVPSPMENSNKASQYWYEPSGAGPNNIRCTSCHDADPFIWSKYIMQVADPGNWNPNGLWNSNYDGMFGSPVTTFKPSNNSCVSCHRFGSEVCDRTDSGGGHVSVKEVADKHWMPPGFSGTNAQWNSSFNASLQQIFDCCDNPNGSGCNPKEAKAEPDGDGDFVADVLDNCPINKNTNQFNNDTDTLGDVCDNCPHVANQNQQDGDGDKVGNVCDNCPGDPNTNQLNTDGDSQGNVCDADDDNDFCPDNVDDKPLVDFSVIGSRLAVNCPDQQIPVTMWDGEDPDNDGKRNCNDNDDDNDGILDKDDPCPVVAGTVCFYPPTSCPLQHWWDVCMFGGCNELLVKIMSVVNPNPELWVTKFRTHEQELILEAQGEQTVEVIEAAVLGQAQMSAVAGKQRSMASKVRIEIWSKTKDGKPGKLIATVAEYSPALAKRQKSTGRTAVVLSLARSGAVSLQNVATIPRVKPGTKISVKTTLPNDKMTDKVKAPAAH